MTYVLAEMAGVAEAPGLRHPRHEAARSRRCKAPDGSPLEVLVDDAPDRLRRSYAMKWDGEWQITYEVFRDMGIAFAAVLVLIYFLVVGWFRRS